MFQKETDSVPRPQNTSFLITEHKDYIGVG